MERTRQKLEKLKECVARGDLKQPEKIGATVERITQRSRLSLFRLEPQGRVARILRERDTPRS